MERDRVRLLSVRIKGSFGKRTMHLRAIHGPDLLSGQQPASHNPDRNS